MESMLHSSSKFIFQSLGMRSSKSLHLFRVQLLNPVNESPWLDCVFISLYLSTATEIDIREPIQTSNYQYQSSRYKSFYKSLVSWSTSERINQNISTQLLSKFLIAFFPVTFSNDDMLGTLIYQYLFLILSLYNVNDCNILSFGHSVKHFSQS